MKLIITCCGTVNTPDIETDSRDPQVVWCDGCQRYFAVRIGYHFHYYSLDEYEE